MKTWLLLFLLVPASAFAQVEVVAKYRGTYPTPMSAAQKVDLLRHVAGEVRGGLLVKRDGTNCGGYSCDIVCFSDAVLFDVLEDQDTAATPRWNPTTNPRGYRCELVAPTAPSPSPIPTPPPVPVPVFDPTPLLHRLEAIEAALLELDARERADVDANKSEHRQDNGVLMHTIERLDTTLQALRCHAYANLGRFGKVPVGCQIVLPEAK